MWTASTSSFSAASVSASWLAGFTVCLTLIVSIGAQNLYVLRQAVQGRHVRACVAWCVVCDALLVAVGVAGMAQLLGRSPTLAHYLTLGGAVFLFAYGCFAWHRAFFALQAGLAATGRAERGVLGVLGALAVITLLNPHVYLDTVVLIGSIGARQDGGLKWVFVVGAASASLLWFLLLAFAGRRLQNVFANPLAWRVLDTLTGATMFALAWWVARSLQVE
ncbi:LysE/ArgO family amino acid transporter [Paracidovorax valerianellae]|uniref:L-lysine exporter family protein LysE/ArgO n=1 Tax=Paracidovorax valerianellae TaxID=187868 RepID=A0A1G7C0J7_9BURK|nr:LysE family transporter [Paracidovorax valerianellae]MDA8446620.1 LysE family transporter [Paracidovorax valerianellae]SDE32216.1 L-lysine exporter family protein LysE/ArgO [Paracidovorax valerianellae]